MANHAWVKTHRKMTPEAISEIIDRLNKTLFKNCIKVEYHKSTKAEPGWGEHTWMLTAINPDDPKIEYGTRVCWLEKPTRFEMRHGGGTNFMWWIDHAICNEVAVQFNGGWYDDADGVRREGTPGKYRRFREYNRRMYGHFWTRTKEFQERNPKRKWDAKGQMMKLWAFMQMDEEYIPPVFRQQNWRFFVKMGGSNETGMQLSAEVNPKYEKKA